MRPPRRLLGCAGREDVPAVRDPAVRGLRMTGHTHDEGAGAATDASGEDLYRIVRDYAALGHHRSGTDRDLATAEWFAHLVSDLGTVTTTVVEFERYDTSSELLVGGRTIDHLALYYEFIGDADTTDVAVRRLDPRSGGFPRIADELIAETKQEGCEALVIATDHPEGDLVAINRDLDAPASGLPTVLVAGRHYDVLASGPVRLRLRARLVPGRTANIEVSNDQPGERLVLTTPLNGWFGAAGERGTGIAVLRHVAGQLAGRPLAIVAAGGGDLAIWDERSTLHRAAADHFPQRRIIRRLEIDGDRPYYDPNSA